MNTRDQIEFTIWLQENQKSFLRAAKMICFDTQNAEDVLQEALADVFKRWNKIREHENPEAYLMRVMVSRHADMRRKWLRLDTYVSLFSTCATPTLLLLECLIPKSPVESARLKPFSIVADLIIL